MNFVYRILWYKCRYVTDSNRIKFIILFLSIELYFLIYTMNVVENIGVEPMTSCVQGKRSSQLS